MKLLQHTNGMVIAFGFDMLNRRPDPHIISWSDYDGATWEGTAMNCAGFWRARFHVEPEFVTERDGRVIAYQPGICIEMTNIGPPYVWAFTTLQADAPQLSKAA